MAEMSFDEMVNQNYTFVSSEYQFIQFSSELANLTMQRLDDASRVSSMTKFLRREIKLGGQVVEGFTNKSQLGAKLREFSQKNRKVLVQCDVNRRMYESVMTFSGLNAVEGRESFFASSAYVSFKLPKAYLFLKTLDQMKAAGHFYHFLEKAEYEYNKFWMQKIRLEMQEVAKQANWVNEDSYRAEFPDSVCTETFLLFLYSLIMCLSCVTF